MRAHETRERSSTLLFLHALTPLAEQLGIQVLAGVGAVVDAGGNCDDEALRKAKVLRIQKNVGMDFGAQSQNLKAGCSRGVGVMKVI